MWKMRLVGCLVLLLVIGTYAGAESVEMTSETMKKVGPAVTLPAITAPSSDAAKEAAAPVTEKDRKAVTPPPEAAVSAPPTGRPIAIVENTLYTFPAVMEGEEVVHDFAFRNAGDAPLIIEQVNAG